MAEPKVFQFWHERLHVFRVGLKFVAFVDELESRWFRGNCRRRQQLTDAADSIVLNIAEGASQTSTKARHNFHRIAMGSAGECDAILEILQIKGCPVSAGRDLLARIGAMLSRMNRRAS